jgi:hypothetical protein
MIKFFWFLFFIFSLNYSHAQVLKAKIVDPDGNPVKSAKVFYNNSTILAKTNASGVFSISADVQIPNPELVIYHPSYEIYIDYQTDKLQPVYQLRPKAENLSIITNNSDYSRDELLFFFKRLFLGTGKYARKTEILNPEHISIGFNTQRQTLVAKSSAPLIVQNQGLGYVIEYYLEDFEAEFSSVIIDNEYLVNVYTVGRSYFRSLDASKAKERDGIYASSLSYFFKQVAHEDYKHLSYKVLVDELKVKPQHVFEKVEQEGEQYRIYFNKKLGRVNEFDEFTIFLSLISKQRRIDIEFFKDSVLVDKYGNFVNNEYMFIAQEATNSRLSDRIPIDYELSNNK